MTMKKIFKHILLSALTITAVASCADDRNNFLPEDSFGFNNVANENLLTLPIYGGSHTLNIIKSGKGLNEGTVNITTDLDSALAVFNKANNTEYIALPADQNLYAFSSESITFGVDEVSKPLEITWDVAKVSDYMTKNPESKFCIPVVLKSDVLEVNEGRGLFVLNISKSTLTAVQTNVSKAVLWESEAGRSEMSINVQLDRAIDSFDLEVNFTVDKTLVDTFNQENETNYEVAPEGLLTVGADPVILAGKKDAALSISVNTEVLVDPATGLIKRDWEGYVLPVKLTGVSEEGILLNNTLTYVVVKGMKPVANQAFERIWGFYSDGALKLPWFINNGLSVNGLVGTTFKGDDRSFTMNDEYVFITKSSGTPGVYKFDIQTGAFVGELDVTGMAAAGATYPTSCPRMAPNSNPDINGGEDVLVIGGLTTDGAPLTLFAYLNGIDAAPEKVYSLGGARRFGDKISFAGTWQSGKFWLRSNQAGTALVAKIPVTDGKVQSWIDAHAMTVADYECMSEVYWTPQENGDIQDYCIIGTNSDMGLHLMTGTSKAGAGTLLKSYKNLACTFGWNFFEVNGKKLMAFVDVVDKTRPIVKLIEGDYTTLEGLQAALDAYSEETIIFSAPLQDELDATVMGFEEGIFIGDCCVRTIGDDIYMAAGVNCVGISMFKLNKDFF